MEKRIIGDLYVAAALLAYGATLESIDRTDRNRQKFIFSVPPNEIYYMDGIVPIRVENPSFDFIETKYVNEALWYPPSFIGAIRRAKDAIYSR